MALGFEPAHPGFDEGGFSAAGCSGEKHDAAQGSGGLQQVVGLAVAVCGEEGGVFLIGSKGSATQAPGAEMIFESRGCGRVVSCGLGGHSCGCGCRFGC